MTTRRHFKTTLALAGLLALSGIAPAASVVAAEPERWKDSAEFSYVATAGNSETSTLGFKDKLGRKWDRSAFELNAGVVRAESTTTTRTAIGTPTSFQVHKQSTTDLTAESSFLNGRYDRKITDRFFWFGGAGWDRNRFAGIENRTTAVGGVGNIWIDTDKTKFRTDYAVAYTDETDVVENPDFKAGFTGARLSSNFHRKVGANATYTNDLVLDENLNETADYRASMINSLTGSMNSRLALKVSLQWLYDHQPALKSVDLLDAPPPVGVKTGTVLVPLDDLDTVFTASLVVNF